MTTLQIRYGDHSVIVNGEDLLFSAQGLYRLDVDGDHLILQAEAVEAATTQNAEPALQAEIERLRGDLEESDSALAAQRRATDVVLEASQTKDQRIRTLEKANQELRDALRTREQATDVGDNFWNNFVQSQNPKTPNVRYRVSLYRQKNGRVRGVCQCMDFHLHGAGPLDTLYYCKHIEHQIREANGVKPAAESRFLTTGFAR